MNAKIIPAKPVRLLHKNFTAVRSRIFVTCRTLTVKKFAAIFLIFLLLFHWYGYRFVTNYLEKIADKQMEARLDVNDYDESQLTEIKIPLNMPYQNGSSKFERFYGEIEINGEIHTYVKRRVGDGHLILKCIPNTLKQKIKNAGYIFLNTNNGLELQHNGHEPLPTAKVFKSILADYENYYSSPDLSITPGLNNKKIFYTTSLFQSITLPVSEQPPEMMSS